MSPLYFSFSSSFLYILHQALSCWGEENKQTKNLSCFFFVFDILLESGEGDKDSLHYRVCKQQKRLSKVHQCRSTCLVIWLLKCTSSSTSALFEELGVVNVWFFSRFFKHNAIDSYHYSQSELFYIGFISRSVDTLDFFRVLISDTMLNWS